MNYRNISVLKNSIKELPESERPREKMQARGVQALSDFELLCGLLGRGSKNYPLQDVACSVLMFLAETHPDNVNVRELTNIKGLGPAGAALICSSLEFGRRFSGIKRKVICNTEDAFNVVRHYGDRSQEHFLAIILNGALELMRTEVVSVGLVNRTLVHPREVFSSAILMRGTSVILAHNHPSGNLVPSADDLETTKRIADAGKILGINILDHLIFSSESYYSIKESDNICLL